MIDRVSDRSKGFGFVTFASEDEADKAVTEMNGKVLISFASSFYSVLEALTDTLSLAATKWAYYFCRPCQT